MARAAATRSLRARQLAAASALLATAASVALDRGGEAIVVTAAALLVQVGFALALARAAVRLHERARDVVAAGDGGLHVSEVDAELARLGGRSRRERLAGELERALYAAEHWRGLWGPARPLPSVRNLLGCADVAREVAQLVRDQRTAVRGVALLDRLLAGGCSSAIYAGTPESLAEELSRIRYLLTS